MGQNFMHEYSIWQQLIKIFGKIKSLNVIAHYINSFHSILKIYES
jgi:hypothetical protein